MRTTIYKSCYSCGLPIKTLIGGIGWWPVAPTRHNRRRKLHHHKASTTTCLQSRAPEVNLFRSRNPSRHTSWRARPTIVHHRSAVGAPNLNSYLPPYAIPNYTHYSVYVTILINSINEARERSEPFFPWFSKGKNASS